MAIAIWRRLKTSLITCPGHNNIRQNLRSAVLEVDDAFSLETVLGPNIMYGSVQRAVLDFVSSSGKYDVI